MKISPAQQYLKDQKLEYGALRVRKINGDLRLSELAQYDRLHRYFTSEDALIYFNRAKERRI